MHLAAKTRGQAAFLKRLNRGSVAIQHISAEKQPVPFSIQRSR